MLIEWEPLTLIYQGLPNWQELFSFCQKIMAVVMSLFTMLHENKMVQQEKLCTSIKQSKKSEQFSSEN